MPLNSLIDPPITRRGLFALTGTFVLSAAVTGIVGRSWARDLSQPRIALLGSGESLSWLVTNGTSRFLLASGTRPSDFGNALAGAMHPGFERIDILIVPGNPQDLPLASQAINQRRPRYVGVLGESDSLVLAGLRVDETLTDARRFELGRDLTITFKVHQRLAANAERDLLWLAVIEAPGASVTVASDADAIDEFAEEIWTPSLVVNKGAFTTLPHATRFVATCADAIEGPELRQLAAKSMTSGGYVLRVHPGTAAFLNITAAGLQLSDSAQEIAV